MPYMYWILDDATERQRFAAIMPPADFHDLVRATYRDTFLTMVADSRSSRHGKARLVDGLLVASDCGFFCDITGRTRDRSRSVDGAPC